MKQSPPKYKQLADLFILTVFYPREHRDYYLRHLFSDQLQTILGEDSQNKLPLLEYF